MDITKYTDAYLKESFTHAKENIAKLPNNKLAQKRYADLLAEMKRRGFIEYK